MEVDAQAEIPRKAVRALKARLQVVKNHLNPLLSRPLTEVYTKLPLTERYELQVLLSYSLNTLFYIYMRTQGSDPQKHEVMEELVRVQRYIKKLKQVQGNGDKPTLKVDKDAAARFIKSALSENKDTVQKESKEVVDVDSSSSSSSEEEEEVKDKHKKRKMNAFAKSEPSKKKKKQSS